MSKAVENAKLAKLKLFLHPATIISTCGYVGKIPFMPGTWGSLVGLLFVVYIFFQPHLRVIGDDLVIDYASGIISKNMIIPFLIGSTIITTIIGTWAAEVYSKLTNSSDASEVVIDEVAGILLAFSLVVLIYGGLIAYKPTEYTQTLMATPIFIIVIFVLFRIFDISKLWHIGIVEKKYKGGWGIMVDDLVAGVYTAVTFYVIFFIAKYFGFFDFYFSKFFQ
jgi:phosphatidylglycerophosphatase A